MEKSIKDGKGKLSEQSYSVEVPKRPEATGSNSVQASSAKLQDQVTFIIIYFF